MANTGFFARTIAAVIRWALARKAVRAVLLYVDRRGPMLADSITYRTLFSVFAAVLLGFSVAALWLSQDGAAWNAIVRAVDAAIPGLFGEEGVIDPDAIRAPVGFSLTGAVSLVALVGSTLGAIGSLRLALRTIAGTIDADVFWLWVVLRNLLLAVGIGAAFVAAAVLTFAGRLGVQWLTGLLGVASDSPVAGVAVRLVSLLAVFLLDVAVIAGSIRVLSGLRPSARSLWPGVAAGAVGLVVLQELSGLFVGGASSNPLLATFASLLALLIWFNFSAQVVLLACSYVVVGVEEEQDRVHARFGAQTFSQLRVRRAEQDVATATEALRQARDVERTERTAAG